MAEAGQQPRLRNTVPALARARARPGGAEAAEERLERLHAYFLEGCTDEFRPVLEIRARGRAPRARGLRRRRRRRRARVGLVRSRGDRGARRRARARRRGRARRCSRRRRGLARSPSPPLVSRSSARSPHSPKLLELPPLLAVEIVLGVLLGFGVLVRRRRSGRARRNGIECVLSLGSADRPSRRIRAEAKATLRQRSRLSLLGGSQLRSVARAAVRRGVRARSSAGSDSLDQSIADAYLAEAAAALGPVSSASSCSSTRPRASRRSSRPRSGASCAWASTSTTGRSRTFSLWRPTCGSCRSRCTRSSSRATASRRTGASTTSARGSSSSTVSCARSRTRSRRRASSAARSARSCTARSTRSRSAPGSSAELEIRGDPDSLSSAQRITVFRAIQEALANVREHAGATSVSVRVRARRSAIELHIEDDGVGLRGRARAREGCTARPPRPRRDRRARSHGRRHVRGREPSRWADDAQADAPALGAAHPCGGSPARRAADHETNEERRRRSLDLLRPFPLPPQPVPPPGRGRSCVRLVVLLVASLDTHLPNAFRLFLFVPYLLAKACGADWARSALHFLAALSVLILAVLGLLLRQRGHALAERVPLVRVRAVLGRERRLAHRVARSALHVLAALPASDDALRACREMHLPIALLELPFGANVDWNPCAPIVFNCSAHS